MRTVLQRKDIQHTTGSIRATVIAGLISVVSALTAVGVSAPVFASDNHQLDTSEPLLLAELFSTLPDTCATPDAFAIAPDNSLTLSCPNYANSAGKQQGALLSISKTGDVSSLGNLSDFVEGGATRPMGLDYAPDGSLFISDNLGNGKGRVLRVLIEQGQISSTEVVAKGLSSPNGLRYHNGSIFITQLRLPDVSGPHMASGIYRFSETDRDVEVANDGSSSTLIFLDYTTNPKANFGLDGLVFDQKGNLFTANLGDGIVYKLELDAEGNVKNKNVYASVPNTVGPDGMAIDDSGNLYLAGFRSNQIIKVDVEGKAILLAQNADSDGANGELDQPADLIVYGDRLIISNFDLMSGEGIVNTVHSKPYTISSIDLKN